MQKNIYNFSLSMAKKSHKERLIQLVYILFVVVGVVMVWRGVWSLIDLYLFPNNPILSSILSVVIGIIMLYFPDKDLKKLL